MKNMFHQSLRLRKLKKKVLYTLSGRCSYLIFASVEIMMLFLWRCKLFYKSGDQWIERGLGNLHIVPLEDEKFQLLVRADTNLGKVLKENISLPTL